MWLLRILRLLKILRLLRVLRLLGVLWLLKILRLLGVLRLLDGCLCDLTATIPAEGIIAMHERTALGTEHKNTSFYIFHMIVWNLL